MQDRFRSESGDILEKRVLSWDTEVCAKATFDDIGPGKLKSFLKLSGLKFDTIPNSLEKLNLVRDGKLLNAAVLCFARKPRVRG